MKKFIAVLFLWVLPFFTFAACNIDVSDSELRNISLRLLEHIKSINTIANGYKGIDVSEGMWLRSLSKDINNTQSELPHLRDLAYLRKSISGNENQKIVRQVLINALTFSSENASVNKDYLLEVSPLIVNHSASSEIAQVIVILSEVVHLGDSCPKLE